MTAKTRGFWLPSSEVLCGKCHGPTYKWDTAHGPKGTTIPDFEANYLTPFEPEGQDDDHDDDVDDIIGGTCDKCGAGVWLTGTVGTCQLAVRLLSTAVGAREAIPGVSLWQTGGMCVAAGVNLGTQDDSAYFLITEDEDWMAAQPRAERYTDPHVVVGLYDKDGEVGNYTTVPLSQLPAIIAPVVAVGPDQLIAGGPMRAWAIEQARKIADDDLEVDDNPKVSPSSCGCWVAAWIYVPWPDDHFTAQDNAFHKACADIGVSVS